MIQPFLAYAGIFTFGAAMCLVGAVGLLRLTDRNETALCCATIFGAVTMAATYLATALAVLERFPK